MFVRVKRAAGSDKLRIQIVESIREGDRVRQRVLRHVGTADSEAQLRQLKQLGQTILEELRQARTPQQHLFSPEHYAELFQQSRQAAARPAPFGVDLSQCREEARVSVGLREAIGELYRRLGWGRLLGARHASGNRIVQELVLARIAQPQSKRSTVRALAEHGDVRLNLEYVYRTLDLLDEAVIERIQQDSLEAARRLHPEPLSVIFYDTTTLAFASEQDDALRRKGYSKDGKPHRVQVLFALLVTPEGIPVGYRLLPGDTYEGTTLIAAMEELRGRHPGVRFTVVADAGLINRTNEAALREHQIPYILGARLKASPKAIKEKVLEAEGFRPWPVDSGLADLPVDRYRCLQTDGARLVVTYSQRRARKDARERERHLEKLRKQLQKNGQSAAVSRHGYARFLDFPEGRVTINAAKVAEAVRWDGLHGIKAWGLEGSEPPRLVGEYRRLWEIEACFRANKHDLKIRPVFHWKAERVRAHIAICYMAFCCLQNLRHRLAVQGRPMSPARIQRALNGLQFSILTAKGKQQYALPSRATADARQIYRLLGLKWNEAPFPIVGRPPGVKS